MCVLDSPSSTLTITNVRARAKILSVRCEDADNGIGRRSTSHPSSGESFLFPGEAAEANEREGETARRPTNPRLSVWSFSCPHSPSPSVPPFLLLFLSFPLFLLKPNRANISETASVNCRKEGGRRQGREELR